MSDVHPLLAGCPREYWNELDAIHAAQAAVAGAVDELRDAFASVLDPGGRIPPDYWSLSLSPLLWTLLSFVFDHAATPGEGDPQTGAIPASGFSARNCIELIHDDARVQEWIRKHIDRALKSAAGPQEQSASLAREESRESTSRKTPARTHGPLGRLRRAFMPWEGHADIVHFAAPFTHAEARRMARASHGRIRRLAFPEHSARVVYSGAARQTLLAQCREKPLTSPLANIALPLAVGLAPSACVEQLDEVWHWVERQPLPRVVATVLGGERSPYFAALVARVRAEGGQLIGMQHGGYYGATDPFWYEMLEYAVCDRFATWGFRHQDKHTPMPAVRLSQLPRCEPPANPPGGGRPLRLLWVHDTNVGGTSSLAAIPHPRRQFAFEAELARSLGQVATGLGANVALRPYPRLPGPTALDPWRLAIPGLQVEPGAGRSLVTHAQLHDVSLFGFPGATGFIEHVHCGWPALIFCPPGFCPIRPEARAVFDSLKSSGLYAETEAELAAALRAFGAGGTQWWEAAERRAARELFQSTFCLTSTDPCADWAHGLMEWEISGRSNNEQTSDSSPIP